MAAMIARDAPVSPFILPLTVHPNALHVVIDADGNSVADCGEPWKFSLAREHRLKMLHEAEAYAAHVVSLANAYPDIVGVIRDLLDGDEVAKARVHARLLLLKLEAGL